MKAPFCLGAAVLLLYADERCGVDNTGNPQPGHFTASHKGSVVGVFFRRSVLLTRWDVMKVWCLFQTTFVK